MDFFNLAIYDIGRVFLIDPRFFIIGSFTSKVDNRFILCREHVYVFMHDVFDILGNHDSRF